MIRTGGACLSEFIYRSCTARREFFTNSNIMRCRCGVTYGNVKSGPPYMSTSGADPYSRRQIARASSLAIRATIMGDSFVFMSPITPGSGSGSCKATCCPISMRIPILDM
uniref:Pdlk1 n=1 Tax=Arundo donax TaxID=35708 RepID=A0A0A9EI72_ARUDO